MRVSELEDANRQLLEQSDAKDAQVRALQDKCERIASENKRLERESLESKKLIDEFIKQATSFLKAQRTPDQHIMNQSLSDNIDRQPKQRTNIAMPEKAYKDSAKPKNTTGVFDKPTKDNVNPRQGTGVFDRLTKDNVTPKFTIQEPRDQPNRSLASLMNPKAEMFQTNE